VQTLENWVGYGPSPPAAIATIGEPIYTPFLGAIIECRTPCDAAKVAAAHQLLRSTDLASMLPDEFERLLASLSAQATESVRRAMRDAARSMRSRDWIGGMFPAEVR
jgi:hypothetical protein